MAKDVSVVGYSYPELRSLADDCLGKTRNVEKGKIGRAG